MDTVKTTPEVPMDVQKELEKRGIKVRTDKRMLGESTDVKDAYVDIVFCIDVTGSMSPVINTIKELTLELYDDLVEHMLTHNSRVVRQLRVKVISFRDFYVESGEYALKESPLFSLPAQKNEFRTFVENLQAKGGGDEPESALEAIATAMKTDWVKVEDDPTKRYRHVIIVFTDASAHPLEKLKECVTFPEGYPEDMPGEYIEVYNALCGAGKPPYNMDTMSQRLIVFAPDDAYPWTDMTNEINYATFVPISATQGGVEIGKEAIVAVIGGSLR